MTVINDVIIGTIGSTLTDYLTEWADEIGDKIGSGKANVSFKISMHEKSGSVVIDYKFCIASENLKAEPRKDVIDNKQLKLLEE